jgi:hypothetical protein
LLKLIKLDLAAVIVPGFCLAESRELQTECLRQPLLTMRDYYQEKDDRCA